MLSIDNAVELMVKTYLALPKKVTGLHIKRTELEEINQSFPMLLDALENHAPDKLDGIDLGDIEWYHRLRNQLYHDGNGLTVVREKALVYAELAQLLFQRLFGFEIQVEKFDQTDLVGKFITTWAEFYRALEKLTKERLPDLNPRGSMSIIPELASHGYLDERTVDQIIKLRKLRNDVIHGNLSNLVRENVEDLKRIVDRVQSAKPPELFSQLPK